MGFQCNECGMMEGSMKMLQKHKREKHEFIGKADETIPAKRKNDKEDSPEEREDKDKGSLERNTKREEDGEAID